MYKKIISMSELLQSGKKIAFIKGNRKVNSKNVKSKKTSFEKFKMNLIPLMYVSGEKAIADGCTLIDAKTEEEISPDKASEYIAIVDGQHRTTAALESEMSNDNLFLFECYCDANTKELVASTNIDSSPWDGKDYAYSAVMFNPESKLAQMANEMSDAGYAVSTIGLILYFNSGKLGKKDLSNIMAGKEPKEGYDFERADYFLKKARVKFKDDFIGKKYLISAVMDLSNKKGYEKVCDALEKLSENQIKRINDASSDDKIGVIKTILKGFLEN
jgi:hypothetical protein